jgi:hypothetical protein
VDLDERGKFVARPIQMKAATRAAFILDRKFAKFPGLVLAYVWNVGSPSETKCFALTYGDALAVADKMGWTKAAAWVTGGRYTTTAPSKRLCGLLAAYEMNSEKWREKISSLT